MAGNNSTIAIAPSSGSLAVRVGTLILMQCFILPGNLLILLAISRFKKQRAVSDVLIGCLALIDLINGLGPVNISIAMYLTHARGLATLRNYNWLCLLYTWMSGVLRMMACFTATLMSMDRFVAIVAPFQYRAKARPKLAYSILCSLAAFSVVVNLLPVLGLVRVNVLMQMCSFAFNGPFATFVMVLGYLQALVVVVCYVSVMLEINAFLSRQTMLKATQLRASFASKSRLSSKRDNTGGDVSPRVAQYSPQAPRITVDTEHRNTGQGSSTLSRCIRSNSLMPYCETERERQLGMRGDRSSSWTPLTVQRGSLPFTILARKARSSSLSPNMGKKISWFQGSPDSASPCDQRQEDLHDKNRVEELNEAMVQSSLRDFKRNHRTWKQSRRLALVMGIVVVLFYISWLPIVVIITASLLSKTTSGMLHFAAARMSLVSSMLNFFVYGGMLMHYREAYRMILRRIFGCPEQAARGTQPQSKPQTTQKARTTQRRRKWFSTSSVDNKEEQKIDKRKRVRFKTINAIVPLIELNVEVDAKNSKDPVQPEKSS
eukprot:gene15745-17334_t